MKLHLPKGIRTSLLACIRATASLSISLTTGALAGGFFLATLSTPAQAQEYTSGSHTITSKFSGNEAVSISGEGTQVTVTVSGSQEGFTGGDVTIGAGSTLILSNSDTLGWGNPGVNSVTLNGEDGKIATLQLNNRQTFSSTLYLNGHTLVSGTGSGVTGTAQGGFDPLSGTAAYVATGGNNTISATLFEREGQTINVKGENSTLTLTGNFSNNGSNGNLTNKTGSGTLIFNAAEGKTQSLEHSGLNVQEGTVIAENALTTKALKLATGTSFTNNNTLSLVASGSLTLGTTLVNTGTLNLASNVTFSLAEGWLRCVPASTPAPTENGVADATIQLIRNEGSGKVQIGGQDMTESDSLTFTDAAGTAYSVSKDGTTTASVYNVVTGTLNYSETFTDSNAGASAAGIHFYGGTLNVDLSSADTPASKEIVLIGSADKNITFGSSKTRLTGNIFSTEGSTGDLILSGGGSASGNPGTGLFLQGDILLGADNLLIIDAGNVTWGGHNNNGGTTDGYGFTSSLQAGGIQVRNGATFQLQHAPGAILPEIELQGGTLRVHDMKKDEDGVPMIHHFEKLSVSDTPSTILTYWKSNLHFDVLTGNANLNISGQHIDTGSFTTFGLLKDYSGTITSSTNSNHTLSINSADQANGKEATVSCASRSTADFVKTGEGAVAFSSHTAQGAFEVQGGLLTADTLTLTAGHAFSLTGGTFGVKNALTVGTEGNAADGTTATLGEVTLGSTGFTGGITVHAPTNFIGTVTNNAALTLNGNISVSQTSLAGLKHADSITLPQSHGYALRTYILVQGGSGSLSLGNTATLTVGGVTLDENSYSAGANSLTFTQELTGASYYITSGEVSYSSIFTGEGAGAAATDIQLHGGTLMADTNASKNIVLAGAGDRSLSFGDSAQTLLTGTITAAEEASGDLILSGGGTVGNFPGNGLYLQGDIDLGEQCSLVINSGVVTWGGHGNKSYGASTLVSKDIQVKSGATFQLHHLVNDSEGQPLTLPTVMLRGGILRVQDMQNASDSLRIQKLDVSAENSTVTFRWKGGLNIGELTGDKNLMINKGDQECAVLVDSLKNYHGTISSTLAAGQLIINSADQTLHATATINATSASGTGFVKTGEGSVVFNQNHIFSDTVTLEAGTLAYNAGLIVTRNTLAELDFVADPAPIPSTGNGYESGTFTLVKGTSGSLVLGNNASLQVNGVTLSADRYLVESASLTFTHENPYGTYYINSSATYDASVMGTASNLYITDGQTLTFGNTNWAKKLTLAGGTVKLQPGSLQNGSSVTLVSAEGSMSENRIAAANSSLRNTVNGTGNLTLEQIASNTYDLFGSITHTGDLTIEAYAGSNYAIDLESGATINNTGKVALTSGTLYMISGSTLGPNVTQLCVSGADFKAEAGTNLSVKGISLSDGGRLLLQQQFTLTGGLSATLHGESTPVDALILTGGTLSSSADQVFAQNATLGTVTLGGVQNYSGGSITIGGEETTTTFIGTVTNAGNLTLGGNLVVNDLTALESTGETYSDNDNGFLTGGTYTLVKGQTGEGLSLTLAEGTTLTVQGVQLNAGSGYNKGDNSLTFTYTNPNGSYYINTGEVSYSATFTGEGTGAAAADIQLKGGTLAIDANAGKSIVLIGEGDKTLSFGGAGQTLLTSTITAAESASGDLVLSGGGTVGTTDSPNHGLFLQGDIMLGASVSLRIDEGVVTWGGHQNGEANGYGKNALLEAKDIQVAQGATFQLHHSVTSSNGETLILPDVVLKGGKLHVQDMASNATLKARTLKLLTADATLSFSWKGKLHFAELTGDYNLSITKGTNEADAPKCAVTFNTLKDYSGTLTSTLTEGNLIINAADQALDKTAIIDGISSSAPGFVKTGEGGVVFNQNHSFGGMVTLESGSLTYNADLIVAKNVLSGLDFVATPPSAPTTDNGYESGTFTLVKGTGGTLQLGDNARLVVDGVTLEADQYQLEDSSLNFTHQNPYGTYYINSTTAYDASVMGTASNIYVASGQTFAFGGADWNKQLTLAGATVVMQPQGSLTNGSTVTLVSEGEMSENKISAVNSTLYSTVNGTGNLTLERYNTNDVFNIKGNIKHRGDLTIVGTLTATGGSINNSGKVTISDGTLTMQSGATLGNNVTQLCVSEGDFKAASGSNLTARGISLSQGGRVLLQQQLSLTGSLTTTVDGKTIPLDALILTGGTLSSSVDQVFAQNATLGTVTLGGVQSYSGGSITIGGKDTTTTFIGTMTNAGKLTLGGNLVVNDLSTLESTDITYSDNGNGFLSGGTYTLVKGQTGEGLSLTLAEGTTLTVQGVQLSASSGYSKGDNSLTFTYANPNGTYYINSGTVVYGSNAEIANAQKIVFTAAGTQLSMSASLSDAADSGIVVQENAVIKLNGTNVNLSNSELSIDSGKTVTLEGSGTYSVEGLTGDNKINDESVAASAAHHLSSISGLTDADKWTGTLQFADTEFRFGDLNAYGNSDSSIELTGATGFFKTETSTGYDTPASRPKNTVTYDMHFKLTGTGEDGTGTAFSQNNGNNGDEFIFNGKVSGKGDYVRSGAGSNQYYTFSGDVSEWYGAFSHNTSHSDYHSHVTFTGLATEINAGVKGRQNNGNHLLVKYASNEQNDAMTINGIISGRVNLTFSGDGEKTLTNTDNDYSGTTLIESGSVVVNNGVQLGTGAVSVKGEGSLTLNKGAAVRSEVSMKDGSDNAIATIAKKEGATESPLTGVTLNKAGLYGTTVSGEGAGKTYAGGTLRDATVTINQAFALEGVTVTDCVFNINNALEVGSNTSIDADSVVHIGTSGALVSDAALHLGNGGNTLELGTQNAAGSTVTFSVQGTQLTFTSSQLQHVQSGSFILNLNTELAHADLQAALSMHCDLKFVFTNTHNSTQSTPAPQQLMMPMTLASNASGNAMPLTDATAPSLQFSLGESFTNAGYRADSFNLSTMEDGSTVLTLTHPNGAIPEPTTATLSLLALAALAARRRRH